MMSPVSRPHRAAVAVAYSLFAFLCAAQPLSAQETDGQSAALRNSGEVEILGARGVQVSVDQKPVLTLPLSSPLSLSAGSHDITATQDGKTLQTTITVREGRALEVRFNFEVQAVSMTVPPHALLLEKYEGIPSALADELAITTVRSLSKQRLAVLTPPKHAQIPNDCAQTIPCLLSQAAVHESDYAIAVSVVQLAGAQPTSPIDYRIEGKIIDRSVSQESAQQTESCIGCSALQVTDKLRRMITELATKALSRTKGTLIITTEPANAAIKIDGVYRGQSPLRSVIWTGTVSVSASLPSHRLQSERVTVREGAETPVQLTLQAEEQVAEQKRQVIILPRDVPLEREPRPRWRLIAGSIGMGVGAVLMGFGVSALSIDGKCVSEPTGIARYCDNLYDTTAAGSSLVGVGGAVLVGSGILLAWPGKPKQRPLSALQLQH